MRIFHVVL